MSDDEAFLLVVYRFILIQFTRSLKQNNILFLTLNQSSFDRSHREILTLVKD